MNRRWYAWTFGLLGLTTAGEGGPASSPPKTANTRPTAPVPPPSPQTVSKAAESPGDPYAPMRVATREAIPRPADLFYQGRVVRASNSGPVNTEEADRDFFTDPRMDHGDNSGRVFYHQFILENPHDPEIQERREWFICWTPLNDQARVQRLYRREGLLIEEVTTDGKRLQVHHSAYVGSATAVDVYRWEGDSVGKGRFVLEGSPPPAAIPAKLTPFEIERDRGYALLSDRRFDEAIAAFGKALGQEPRDAAALFALGVAYEEKGSDRTSPAIDLAIQAFSKAIAVEPKRAAALRHRADLYLAKRETDLAIADLTALIALEPKSWEGYLARAKAYSGKADYARAVADTQSAARLAPTEESPWVAMARYQYQAESFETAIASGRKALSLDDSSTLIRVTMACAYARLGMAEKALQEYASARNNGVTATERRFGIRELQRYIKTGKPSPEVRTAIQKVLGQFIGPDQLEALDDGEEI